MPNNIKNRIKVIGTKDQVKEVFKKLNTHYPEKKSKTHDGKFICKDNSGEYGWYDEKTEEFSRREKDTIIGLPIGWEYEKDEAWDRFPDFDKIIPQPEGLEITSDGYISLLENQFSGREPLKPNMDKIKNIVDEERKKETLENFIQGIRNYVKHGHASWYGWNIANWGTKWNCYECEKIDDNIFTFETAWSGVFLIIEKISKSFPDVTFNYTWSDEDTGQNCGNAIYKNGIQSKIVPKNGSKEAYDIAFDLRPEYKKDYCLEDGNYKYKDD